MAVSITISIDQNSQSIANNTSNVTVTVRASWTGGSYNLLEKSGWLKIDGTVYNFTSPFNTGRTTSGTGTLFTKTVNVKHNSDGTKTLATSASYTSGVSSGTVGASVSKTLTTIPRKSTLTVSNGTLGTSQKLTVVRQASSFTHTITYKCGTASGTICTKSSNTSVTWTPPVSLSSQNTTGTSVSVTLTITTYNGNTNVGSSSYTKTYSIPSSVKPSCTISVSDATNIYSTYGSFVKGLSRFAVGVTPELAYNSAISKYEITANRVKYTSSSCVTGYLSSSGNLTIAARVTDKRGRSSDTVTVTKNVLDYSPPSTSTLSVKRCNEDGSDNDQGNYVQVTFAASITSLGNKNSAAYRITYKKTSDEDANAVVVNLDEYAGSYIVSKGSCIFPADGDFSYDVKFEAIDNHNTTTRTTTVSTAYTLMHWNAMGNGMGIGKISELENLLDIGMQTRLNGGLLHPVLEPGTDLNDVRTPNTYVGANVTTYNYGNCPLTSGTFTLEVMGMGEEGQVKQTLTYCHKTASRKWERIYYSNSWGEWICVSDFDGQLLWQGGFFMHGTQEINLAEPISKQKNGIVLVFCRYSSGTIQNYHFSHHFVPKMVVALHAGCGSVFNMGAVEGDYFAAKYLYISDQSIKGNDYNDDVITNANSGITYTNNATVLRYVIGV